LRVAKPIDQLSNIMALKPCIMTYRHQVATRLMDAVRHRLPGGASIATGIIQIAGHSLKQASEAEASWRLVSQTTPKTL
jgi:hypothetical protein